MPEYIDECKRLQIEILKPDINQSSTKFTVHDKKIRFGLGSIKNVGVGAVDAICAERGKNGKYQSFTDFCERISSEAVNKKCVESLIKAGAFDELGETRATLLASFEGILDTISNNEKKSFKGQVSMFDLGGNDENSNLEEIKYNWKVQEELPKKELLFQEKEMLGIYISGHPLENLREQIMAQTNMNTLKMHENMELQDGQNVTVAGIITSVKKKFTKKNTIMAFVGIEDLYGSIEIIVFDSCYQKASSLLLEDNIVLIEGRLSVREDEEPKIVANAIKEFTKKTKKVISFDITGLSDEQKDCLRGAIKFFSGEKNNMPIQIKDGEQTKPAGGMYITEGILEQLQESFGKERVDISEIS